MASKEQIQAARFQPLRYVDWFIFSATETWSSGGITRRREHAAAGE